MRQFFFILLILLLYSNYFCAQETQPAKPFGKNPFSKQEKNIHFSYLWEHETLKPGIATTLAIVIDFDKGWHIQPPAQLIPADYFEKFIVPSTVKVKEISQNAIAQSAIFTPPFSEYSEEFKNNILFYKNKTIVYIPIHLGDNFKEEKLKVNVEIFYQMCNDKICLRGTSEFLTAEINVSPNLESKKIYENIFSQMPKEPIVLKSNGEPQKYGLILMILMACLGGVLLNFTPCVLPIIPIKIMGLSHAAGSRKKSIFLGLIMSAGIISFWLVLGLLISIIPGFTSISKLFQSPLFTISVGVVIAAMAVGMCGLFNIQVPQKIAVLNPRFSSIAGSFGIGIMTAILSTPCTAPFMGAALAWALKQPQYTTLLIFFVIGFGMALPYILLSSFPNLVSWMPKSGPVSVVIKETMGILMLAAASYFIGIGLTSSVNSFNGSSNYWWPTMLIVAFSGIWVIIKTLQIKPSVIKKVVFISIGIFIIMTSFMVLKTMTKEGPLQWKDYTPELFEKAKSENKIIVLDFTAEWCLNCKALEKGVLNSARVSAELSKENVELLKVDISNDSNTANIKLLNSEGSLTIPFFVIYKDGIKIFQSDFYTQEDILKAIGKK